MTLSPKTRVDIKELLVSIHLDMYYPYFQRAGYITVCNCEEINNEVLQKIGIPLTGHRKRILKQIEISFADIEAEPSTSEHITMKCQPGAKKNENVLSGNKDSSKENENTYNMKESEHIFNEKSSEICENKDLRSMTKDSLKHKDNACSDVDNLSSTGSRSMGLPSNTVLVEKSNPLNTANLGSNNDVTKREDGHDKEEQYCSYSLATLPSTQSSDKSATTHEVPDENENMAFQEADGPADESFFEFQGEMVINDIYDEMKTFSKTKTAKQNAGPSRSFILRNRPVPEIPGTSDSAPPVIIPSTSVGITRLHSDESLYAAAEYKSSDESSPDSSTFYEDFGTEFMEDGIGKTKETEGPYRTSWQCMIGIYNDLSEIPKPPQRFAPESEYSTAVELARNLTVPNMEPFKSHSFPRTINNQRNMLSYSSLSDGIDDVTEDQNLLSRDNPSITPYACFYGSSSKREKTGWLDKLSPQGNYMFQKRWVKFDGVTLSYYNNEKEVYSKGIIPVHAIKSVYPHGESKFEVLTSQRKFVFRVEKEGDRNDWVSTLQNALKYHANAVPATAAAPDKSGYLDMKGYKGKMYAALSKNTVVLCKNEQDYKAGLAITNIPMNVANIKHMDRKGFEITTPFKSFSFTAESEREKQEWIEAVQESIADTLSDYEVAEKIWFNESNRNCADCQAADPDWASINLCVIICKNCAGPHRSLGAKLSKVRSLKLDASVWSNELVELFIVVGNKKANSFWAANLPPGKQLQMDSPQEQRQSFIVQKYKEGRFRKHLSCVSQQQLNEALCAAVVKVDLLETMSLVFSGADAICATGDPTHSTPYLLAKKAGQCLQMEFLHHNKFSDYPKCDPGAEIGLLPDSSLSAFLCGFLYKAPNAAKPGPEKKLKEDLNRRWCTMEGGFLSYYEHDKTATPNGMIDLHEVISLVIHKAACYLNSGAIFTFEIYLLSERVFLFGAETVESQREWTQAVAKYFVPAVVGYLTERDYDLVGHMYYKDCHSLDQWKTCWFALEKSYLHYCPVEDNTKGDKIHLRRLQELTASTFIQNGNKIDVLLLVEQGRTLYIHGHSRLDFMAWNSAIEKAAGTDGNALQDQQLGKNDVPITVISCIAFVTQYGLGSKSLYLTNGNPVSVRELVEQFKKDARSVKLRVGQHQLEDVTEVLKCFLSEIDDALLTKELYPYWISVLDVQDEKLRVDKYGTLIQSLPPINRATLAALMEHLYRVCKCSEINCLDTHNLAMAFSSCLYQTEGQNGEEVSVIEDLINNYVQLFQVKEDQVKQMDIENNCITKWKDTQFSLEEDVLIDIYVEKKESECCVLIKVSPTMEADELTKIVLRLKNITPSTNDIWATFEVIKNGELERPLHYREKVLDAVLQWSSLSEPESAYLSVKRFQFMDAFKAPIEKPAADILKAGNLKFKEEPSKLLSGNKFQERYFVLQDGKLSLYKDMKNSKPEKFLSISSSKFYLGVKKKSKSPPSWGFTALCEKHQWLLSCDAQETQMEWFISILMAQHGNDIWPAATKQLHVEGNTSTLIQHGGSHVKMRKKSTECTDPQTGNQHPGANDAEGESIVKQRASLIAHCLERKDDKVRSQAKKHRSMVGLDDTITQGGKLQPTTAGDSKSQKKKEDKPAEVPMVIHKLPTNLMKELNSVLLKNRAHMEAP